MLSTVAAGSSATCPACSAVLVIAGLAPDQAVICPMCSSTIVLRRPGFAVRTSRLAIASLAMGTASLIGMCVTGIPAIILGILALREINVSKESVSGRRLAVGGIVTGGLFGIFCVPFTSALIVKLLQIIARW